MNESTQQNSPDKHIAAIAPYRATIEIDLWVWQRDRAWSVLDQIVTAMEKHATDDNGVVAVHHQFVRADLGKQRADA